MQITIDQHEIERAIRLFVHNEGFDLEGQDVEIEFTMGKKPAGPRATINILPAENTGSDTPAPNQDTDDEPGIPFTFVQEEDED